MPQKPFQKNYSKPKILQFCLEWLAFAICICKLGFCVKNVVFAFLESRSVRNVSGPLLMDSNESKTFKNKLLARVRSEEQRSQNWLLTAMFKIIQSKCACVGSAIEGALILEICILLCFS